MDTTSTSLFDNHVRIDVSLDAGAVAAPGEPAAFVLHTTRENVANYSRENNDLIIQFDDGRVVRIRGFFAHGENYNNLIFEDGNGKGNWSTDFTQAVGQGGDGIVDQLVTYEFIADSNTGLLGIIGGLAAGGGLVGLALGSGGGDGGSAPAPAVDTTPPTAPTVAIAENGDGTITVSGKAEPRCQGGSNAA